ncbi:hypothetical protein BH18THE2_BH18THE2_20270 [soil metagenome]
MIYNWRNLVTKQALLQHIFMIMFLQSLINPLLIPPDTTIHFLAPEESRNLGNIICSFGIMQ